MPDNDKIYELILNVKEDTQKISSDTALIKQRMETMGVTVDKHEKVLYGNPENMGAGGLINTTTGLAKRVDHMRSMLVMVWTGIFAGIQLIISVIRTFLNK